MRWVRLSFIHSNTYIYIPFIHTCICTYIHTYNLKLSRIPFSVYIYVLAFIHTYIHITFTQVESDGSTNQGHLIPGRDIGWGRLAYLFLHYGLCNALNNMVCVTGGTMKSLTAAQVKYNAFFITYKCIYQSMYA